MDPVTVYRKNSISETTTTSDRTTPSVNDAPIDAPSGRSMLQPGLSAAGYDLKFGPTRNRSKPLMMIPPSASVTMMTDSTGSPMKWRKTIRSRTIPENQSDHDGGEDCDDCGEVQPQHGGVAKITTP